MEKDKVVVDQLEPEDYIKGFKEFLGLKIDLSSHGGQTKRPLIPRPETEFWVGQVIKDLNKNSDVFCSSEKHHYLVLDMFCGSGCIGFAILYHVKNTRVIFADKYKYFRNKNFVKSDVFSNIKGKFDFVFANPPYVAIKKRHLIQKSVLQYEPKTALFGGQDGLFYIKKFLRDAIKHLNTDGVIFMEFSPEQKKRIEELLKKYKYKGWKFHKDQFDRWRWVSIY